MTVEASINDDRPAGRHAKACMDRSAPPSLNGCFVMKSSAAILRILKTGDGFAQGYNARAAVDAGSQVIVAHAIFANGRAPAARGRSPADLTAKPGMHRKHLAKRGQEIHARRKPS